jgi:hypothetical protein
VNFPAFFGEIDNYPVRIFVYIKGATADMRAPNRASARREFSLARLLTGDLFGMEIAAYFASTEITSYESTT